MDPSTVKEVRAHKRTEQCVTYFSRKYDCGHEEKKQQQTFCKNAFKSIHNCGPRDATEPRNVYGDCDTCKVIGPANLWEYEAVAAGHLLLQGQHEVLNLATGVPLYIRKSLMDNLWNVTREDLVAGAAKNSLKQLHTVRVYEYDGTKSEDRYYLRDVKDPQTPRNSYHQLTVEGYEIVPENQWLEYWEIARTRPNSVWPSS